MAIEITLKLTCTHRWVEEEADGQECYACGDQCFLFPPKRMEVTVQPGNSIFKMDQVVCASCFDEANSK